MLCQGHVKYFELGSGADSFCMGSSTERPMLLGGGIRLHQEGFLDDLLDVGLFCDEIPLGVALGHSEPPGQEHDDGRTRARTWDPMIKRYLLRDNVA
jgi:hypothetical protein